MTEPMPPELLVPDADGRKYCLRFERFMAPEDFCSGAKKRAEPAERSKDA